METMNIQLVQVDRYEDFGKEILPWGILSVGSALRYAGYEINLIHCTDREIRRKINQILAENPLFVGFSVMTGAQTKHSAIMSKLLKKESDIPIVWGGPHPTLLPEQCLQEDYIDVVVIGEGEETTVELANALKNNKPLNTILGLGFNFGRNKVQITPPRPFIQNLDSYEIDFELLNIENYLFPSHRGRKECGRVIAYKSSRGCIYECNFCYNQKVHKRTWRGRSAEKVIQDIEKLKREYSVDGVKFYDDNFFVDRKRAFKILEGIGVPAHTEIRIDWINDKVARKLQEVDCMELLIGVESGSDRIMNLINKRFHVKDIKESIRIIAKYNLPATYSTICGIPTETVEEAEKTIALMLWIEKTHRDAAFTYVYTYRTPALFYMS